MSQSVFARQVVVSTVMYCLNISAVHSRQYNKQIEIINIGQGRVTTNSPFSAWPRKGVGHETRPQAATATHKLVIMNYAYMLPVTFLYASYILPIYFLYPYELFLYT